MNEPIPNIKPVFVAAFGDLCDITCMSPVSIEISISSEGDRIWINDSYGKCLVRICGIEQAIIIEDRRPKSKKNLTRVKKKDKVKLIHLGPRQRGSGLHHKTHEEQVKEFIGNQYDTRLD